MSMQTNVDFSEMKTHGLLKNVNGSWTAIRKTIRGEMVNTMHLASNVSLDEASDALARDGVMEDDIDVAIEEMFKNDHTYAEFGLGGGFVFSEFRGMKH